MGTECAYCKLIQSNPEALYEDDRLIALVPNKPWVPGHIIVLPKVHAPILERLAEDVAGHLFAVANKLSVASIQAVGAPAATLLLNNGVGAGQMFPHVMVHVLPRFPDDVFHFGDDAKALDVSEATELAVLLKSSLVPKEDPVPDDPDWWIIDQLTRMP